MDNWISLHGLTEYDEPTEEMRREAAARLERMRQMVANLCEKHRPAIEAVAAALSAEGSLTEAQIDDLMSPASPAT